ncbi:4Fe-4S dicluster domain-containing protein [Desulfurobacterium thermolithotrophum]|uniref:4Fe-4S dicluster domain-containing protein n=1 Tax=Desulfurobacterium thermolithotrophum TaxID=64160 RepID=UPI0013D117AD|nr:4Fe-4S dicluster domain-containing protein [Desulfurobacterium thermolithotrophum]
MNTVLVNSERCIGCKHCEIACAIEHSLSKDLFSMLSEEVISKPRIHVEVGKDLLTFPNKCRHCNPAPCMEVCPTYAISRDEKTESVLVDPAKCIACSMCAIACPFGIITFEKTYTVRRCVNVKCDNCIDRQKEGKKPACVEACKTGALIFGDVNDLIRERREEVTKMVTKTLKDQINPKYL